MKSKNILITGGMGFIGKHLVRNLKGNIDIVDNLSSCKYEDLNVNFYKEDFRYFKPKKKYDEIYHLAGPVGPVGVLRYPGIMGREIIDLLDRAIEIAIKDNAKLMFISTSEVYGKNPLYDQPEDIEKIVPPEITVRLEYGVAKLLGEIMLYNRNRHNGFKYNVIRPFNIIGTGQNPDLGFVVPRFINQALKDKPITVYGNGTYKRAFTNVKDIVEAMILIMESNISGEIFNIGNPDSITSIGQLARMIKEMTFSKSEIRLVDPKKLWGNDFAEAWNKIPNIDKAKGLVGWSPKYSLEETLKECIKELK